MNTIQYEIEVAVPPGTSTTERGAMLESVGRDVLVAMQYEVVEQVRLTGIEVDLRATHKVSGECVFVECKAWRDKALPADAITKALGNIELHEVDAAWLISTGPLGKDAKGAQVMWEQKPLEKRRKLLIYDTQRTIELLLSAGNICDPLKLGKPNGPRYADAAYLLISPFGRFWALPILGAGAGTYTSVLLFDAEDGTPVSDRKVIDSVSGTDTSLQDLVWLAPDAEDTDVPDDSSSDSIVMVLAGDEWTDYRPSRPQDFVGRVDLQRQILGFLDEVREGQTPTRLIAIKSPSGWGKSSVLVKLANRVRNRHNRGKYLICPVDVRAATGRRYAELALIRCFEEAARCGFIPAPVSPFVIGATSRPLDTSSFRSALAYLRQHRRVLVLFFDQFEETFTKRSLEGLFDSVRVLGNAIDASRENLVLGFAWKTDGAIPQDHSAYYMWQSLADRRKEYELPRFSRRDVYAALAMFANQLGEKLSPLLKKILIDQCQGYPWLLKKLCIHVFEVVSAGKDQIDAATEGLSIKSLFERDRFGLSPSAAGCLERIAIDSPADFFDVQNLFGSDTVQSLINQRLVIRRGTRLTLYWDIFRDYILSGTVPSIPVNYVPQSEFARYYRALLVLADASSPPSTKQMAQTMGISAGATNNTVRDLVMTGVASKRGDIIILRPASLADAKNEIISFMSRHVVYRSIIREHGSDFVVEITTLEDRLRTLYPDASFADKTWQIYCKRITSWLVETGLARREGNSLVGSGTTKTITEPTLRRRRSAVFLGDAPPERVAEAIRLVAAGQTSAISLAGQGLRNAVRGATMLGLIKIKSGVLSVSTAQSDLETEIKVAAKESFAIRVVLEHLDRGERLSGEAVGEILAHSLQRTWSRASQIRWGNGALRWARWVQS